MPETQSQIELSPAEELIRRYEIQVMRNKKSISELYAKGNGATARNLVIENENIIAKINEIKRTEKII